MAHINSSGTDGMTSKYHKISHSFSFTFMHEILTLTFSFICLLCKESIPLTVNGGQSKIRIEKDDLLGVKQTGRDTHSVLLILGNSVIYQTLPTLQTITLSVHWRYTQLKLLQKGTHQRLTQPQTSHVLRAASRTLMFSFTR